MFTQTQYQNEEIRLNEQSFCQLAESIGVVFWMTDVSKNQMIYVSPGYEKIWGRTCSSLYTSAGDWCEAIHAEDRNRVTEAALSRQVTGEYDEKYRIVTPEGVIHWIHDRAFPIRNELGEVYRIAGIAEDITESKKLEQEVIEMSDREQTRLGQELHDGICQQLVSIAFATDLLRRDLVSKSPPEAVRVAKITELLDSAITQARHLSQALCPVNLVGNGLGIALRELASSISWGLRIACEVDCGEGILILDRAVATHLYRIAQEAVQRATKCASATRILISISQERETIHLSVTDNGVKNGERDKHANDTEFGILKYRASLAGGGLEVQRNPSGGTIVSCHCPQKMP